MFKSFSFFGFLTIHLLPILLILAAFFGAFVFYRLLHKRTTYNEFEIFDGFLLSLFCGFVSGRLSFIAINWSDFHWNFWYWLNFLAHPGVSVMIAIFTSGIFLWIWLKHLKIPDLEILDYWSRATCLGLVFYQLGLFLDGSGGGYLTQLPLGLKFPGQTVAIHPAQLYGATFFLLLFFYLAYLEKNYRTFAWYRGHRSQAKTGFVFIIFLFCYALYGLISLIIQPAHYELYGFQLDWLIYLLILLFAVWLLLHHTLYATKKK